MSEEKKPSYWRRVLHFYLAPRWQSFFSAVYLLFFGYFAFFYVGHLVVALKFILYTIRQSTLLLGLGYLFSGTLFLIALVLPFGVSVYAIVLGYELRSRSWPRNRKYVVATLLFVVVPIIVITADLLVRVVARSETLHDFVVTRNLHLDGKLE